MNKIISDVSDYILFPMNLKRLMQSFFPGDHILNCLNMQLSCIIKDTPSGLFPPVELALNAINGRAFDQMQLSEKINPDTRVITLFFCEKLLTKKAFR